MTAADVERIAGLLMFDDGPAHIQAARERFGQRLGGRDYVYVEISVPDASEGLGEQYEGVYQRTLIAPRGAVEKAVVAIAGVCDELDPGGRNLEAWQPAEAESRPPAEHQSAESPPLSHPAEAGAGTPSETPDDVEPEKLPSLRELTQDLPIDRDQMLGGIVDLPKSEAVIRAFLVDAQRMNYRLDSLRTFIAQLPVPDDIDLDDGRSEKEAARLELADLAESLANLRENLFCYLNHTGAGRLVELDDESVAALRELARAVPRHCCRAHLLVEAAVRYVAGLPNRGGILAIAEQRRLLALAAEYHSREPGGAYWPWSDQTGQPLTADSQSEFRYEPAAASEEERT